MIQTFALYLTSLRGYSENTVKAYIKDLHAFACYMKQARQDARWSNITRDDIDAYIIEQQHRGLKPATTNRQLAAISSLYRFFMRQGICSENPCKYESRRKIGESIPTTIPIEDIRKAYRLSTGVGKQMLGLLATTGIRIQELLDLEWQDVDFDNCELRINGKGNKQRIVKTEPGVLASWKETNKGLHPTGKIFYFGQRTARRIIYDTLRPFCHYKHLNPHTIRHTFATQLAMQGENATSIALALGHNQISTTQRYIDMTIQKKAHLGISLT